MKKILFIGLCFLMVGVFTVPATALEHVFGGYFRVRAYSWTNFTGDDSYNGEAQQTDTRARLYYTAVLSDDVKLVTKFEMDAYFGDDARGDIGADGQNFEIKNSYVDIDLDDFNLKLGTQGKTLARGFMLDDDFSGAVVTYMGDDMEIPFFWIKAYEGYNDPTDPDLYDNDFDVDYYGVDPTFSMGDIQLNPVLMYITSADAQNWAKTADYEALNLYYLGVNLDYAADIFSVWFTGIYQSGTLEELASGDDVNVAAFLAAVGGVYNMDAFSVHAQAFYASGDDDANTFMIPKGQSYYWAEIMGYGLIDEAVSDSAPGDQISNIMAFNVGVTVPLGKLTLMADLWNASLADDNASGDKDLGTEIDLAASYPLKENVKLQAVAAYLLAGDATGGGDENPTEVGVRLSLSF